MPLRLAVAVGHHLPAWIGRLVSERLSGASRSSVVHAWIGQRDGGVDAVTRTLLRLHGRELRSWPTPPTQHPPHLLLPHPPRPSPLCGEDAEYGHHPRQ